MCDYPNGGSNFSSVDVEACDASVFAAGDDLFVVHAQGEDALLVGGVAGRLRLAPRVQQEDALVERPNRGQAPLR
jgi:hypothetical protein